VGVVNVDVGGVEVGVRAGEVIARWFKTKYPAIPARTTTPTIIIKTLANPFWLI